MFESLEKSGILQSFAVDPMASDLVAWKPENFLLFSQRGGSASSLQHGVCRTLTSQLLRLA
jgi:hypothetical protein